MARNKRARRGRPPNEVPSALLEARVPAVLVDLVREQAGKAGVRVGQFLTEILLRELVLWKKGPRLGLWLQGFLDRMEYQMKEKWGDEFEEKWDWGVQIALGEHYLIELKKAEKEQKP